MVTPITIVESSRVCRSGLFGWGANIFQTAEVLGCYRDCYATSRDSLKQIKTIIARQKFSMPSSMRKSRLDPNNPFDGPS
jgi:hypothetical protein